MPYALMNGPKQLYIKFKVSNEDVVLERVMFETRIRYDVELGQESGPGLFRRLKLKQWQKRCENEVRQYRQLATDPGQKTHWMCRTCQIGDPSRSRQWCRRIVRLLALCINQCGQMQLQRNLRQRGFVEHCLMRATTA